MEKIMIVIIIILATYSLTTFIITKDYRKQFNDLCKNIYDNNISNYVYIVTPKFEIKEVMVFELMKYEFNEDYVVEYRDIEDNIFKGTYEECYIFVCETKINLK